MDSLEGFNVDLLLEEVLVGLKWVIHGIEVSMWWSIILLEGGKSFTLLEVGFHLRVEISLREKTEGWNPVVVSCWLEVIVMLEVVSIGVTEVEWHVRITIIDTVQFFTIHELSNVVLDDGVLGMSSMLGSSGRSLNAVTESKDILESSVLEGIWVDIDEASVVGNTSFNEFGVWLRWWVDVQVHEWVLHSLTAINIFESSNLFSVIVFV